MYYNPTVDSDLADGGWWSSPVGHPAFGVGDDETATDE